MCTEELNDVIKRIDGYEENIISSKYDEYEKFFMHFPIIGAAPIDFSFPVFRVRPVEDNVDESSPSSFSYKPQKLIPAMSRLNLKGESVFYGSIYPQTAIKERGIKPNKEFYMSKWIINKRDLTLYRLFNHEELTSNEKASAIINYVDSVRNDDTTKLLSLISEKLTSTINEANKYNFTALYASYVRRNRIFYKLKDEEGNKRNVSIYGFLYKSIKSDNPNELNIALFPDIIDNWGILDSVYKCSVNESFDIITGYKGVYDGTEIKWNNSKFHYRLERP